jgi:predicted dehydrogenase
VGERTVGVGIIGGGLMGREVASAIARWVHLDDIGIVPRVVHVCDVSRPALRWFERLDPRPRLSLSYQDMLEDRAVEAVYCAVPHHLHAQVLGDAIASGRHLLAEKPFGVDLAAATRLCAAAHERPQQLVRISSEMAFQPGGQEVWRWIRASRAGRVIEVRARFLHSSDLDPTKPISWKRQARFNGAYGCMGDLGLHALHLPLRAGWAPTALHAMLSNIVTERPGGNGRHVLCDTWDNATLTCSVEHPDGAFPLIVETKRIAPGETNTWSIEIDGISGSIAYTTKLPKTLRWMDYSPGARQAWMTLDLGSEAAYPTITGAVFEAGFSDALQQMLAAFFDELAHGREGMRQPFHCATPDEALATHRVFTAALASHREGTVVPLPA